MSLPPAIKKACADISASRHFGDVAAFAKCSRQQLELLVFRKASTPLSSDNDARLAHAALLSLLLTPLLAAQVSRQS